MFHLLLTHFCLLLLFGCGTFIYLLKILNMLQCIPFQHVLPPPSPQQLAPCPSCSWSHPPPTYFRTPSPGPGHRPAALHCQRAVGCWLSPPGPCDGAAPATRTQVLLAPISPQEPRFSARPSVDPASSRAAASAHQSAFASVQQRYLLRF